MSAKVGKLRTWEIDRKGKIPKSAWGRVQKVFWTQGAKVSEKSFAPPKTHFAPVQKQFWVVQKTFRRPLLPGSKRPFAPSPKHFWEFSLFGQFPRSAASQRKRAQRQVCKRSGKSKVLVFFRV